MRKVFVILFACSSVLLLALFNPIPDSCETEVDEIFESNRWTINRKIEIPEKLRACAKTDIVSRYVLESVEEHQSAVQIREKIISRDICEDHEPILVCAHRALLDTSFSPVSSVTIPLGIMSEARKIDSLNVQKTDVSLQFLELTLDILNRNSSKTLADRGLANVDPFSRYRSAEYNRVALVELASQEDQLLMESNVRASLLLQRTLASVSKDRELDQRLQKARESLAAFENKSLAVGQNNTRE